MMGPGDSLWKSRVLGSGAEAYVIPLTQDISAPCDFLRHAGGKQGTFWTGISATIFWLPLGYEREMSNCQKFWVVGRAGSIMRCEIKCMNITWSRVLNATWINPEVAVVTRVEGHRRKASGSAVLSGGGLYNVTQSGSCWFSPKTTAAREGKDSQKAKAGL